MKLIDFFRFFIVVFAVSNGQQTNDKKENDIIEKRRSVREFLDSLMNPPSSGSSASASTSSSSSSPMKDTFAPSVPMAQMPITMPFPSFPFRSPNQMTPHFNYVPPNRMYHHHHHPSDPYHHHHHHHPHHYHHPRIFSNYNHLKPAITPVQLLLPADLTGQNSHPIAIAIPVHLPIRYRPTSHQLSDDPMSALASLQGLSSALSSGTHHAPHRSGLGSGTHHYLSGNEFDGEMSATNQFAIYANPFDADDEELSDDNNHLFPTSRNIWY